MFFRLLSIETRKLLKHPLIWLELAGLVAMLGLYFAIRYAMIANAVRNGLANTRGLELDAQLGIGLFTLLNFFFYATTAALISSDDFTQRGVQIWLMRGVPRPLLMFTRLSVALLFGVALVGTAIAVTLGMATLMRTLFLGGYSARDLNWAQLFPATLRIFWGAVPYLALTVLLAIASRSPLVAVSGTIIFRTVLENILLQLENYFPAYTRLLPSLLAAVLKFYTYSIDRTAKAMLLGDRFVSESQAVLLIATLLLLFSSTALFIFSRQDWGG